MSFSQRLKHSWNAFLNRAPTYVANEVGNGSYRRPDRPYYTNGTDRSIVNAIYNRIAVDVSNIEIKHCKVDEDGRYVETVKSSLNDCLTIEANLDQSARAFRKEAIHELLDNGVVAIVPVDTSINPIMSGAYDIESMRVGRIVEWYPKDVVVRLYNEDTGEYEDVRLPKRMVTIVENPFYAVMNEPNSIAQRLIRKMNILDVIDEQSGAGKLDLIIQLPYAVKGEVKKKQAEDRLASITEQLADSKYGIAYADATEKIVQLNRPVENNLMKQIEFLTNLLFSQLGFTQGILDNTADEKTMLNYNNRTIKPLVLLLVEEMKRKFLTKTARTQGHSIEIFTDPFELISMDKLADIADKLTRNEIVTSNEVRQGIGMKPSKDPNADVLRNKNIAAPVDPMAQQTEPSMDGVDEEDSGDDLDIEQIIQELIEEGEL